MGELAKIPKDEDKKEKIRNLKKTLEELVLEKDNLIYIVCENIKTEYMLTFGSLEYRLYKAFCKYMRLRRKKEMIQAKKNREEKVKIEEIENALDEEFAEYQRKLDEKIDEMNEAIERSKCEPLSEEEVIIVKKMYKNIVKKLHPDINPKVTEAQKELFYKATDAYKDGNLTSLKIIYDIVSDEDMDEIPSLSYESLEDEIKRLEDLIENTKFEINRIKTTQPYTWRIYLTDENKRNERLRNLKNNLESFQEGIRTYEEYIKELIKDE